MNISSLHIYIYICSQKPANHQQITHLVIDLASMREFSVWCHGVFFVLASEDVETLNPTWSKSPEENITCSWLSKTTIKTTIFLH